MARDKHATRSKAPKHVRLHAWVMDTPAYRHLSCPARCLLVELMRSFDGGNNGDVFMSVRDAAAAINVSKDTAGGALLELQAVGFIRAKEKGAFSLKKRHATTWILTEYEYANQPASKDFTRWRPAAENQKPVRYRRTDSPNKADRRPDCRTEKQPDGPNNQDCDTHLDSPDGPNKTDTISIPGDGSDFLRGKPLPSSSSSKEPLVEKSRIVSKPVGFPGG